MKKKALFTLGFSLLMLTACANGVAPIDNPGYIPDHLESDPVIKENIKIDGVLDEEFYAKIPYTAKSEYVNRDKNKYEHLRDLPDCTSSTYVGYGENGLFIYLENDDPIVNLTCPEIFNRSGYELYVCSPDVEKVDDNLFEVTAGPDGALLIRVRRSNNSKWVRVPAMESVARGKLLDVGYTVEIYLPYSVLNMKEKIDHIGIGTAMIRLDSKEEYQNHFCWELLEMNTKTRSNTKVDTFPQFDINGCKPEGDGETFKNPHSAAIDVAYDRGDNPYVTFKHNATNSECYLKDDQYFTGDFYWHSKVKVTSFSSGDDPRIGIFIKSKPDEKGFFTQPLNFLELDKAGGDNIVVKDAILLPRLRDESQGSVKTWNDWAKGIRALVDSAITDEYTFDLGIYRHGSTISMYINDTMYAKRNDFAFIEDDTPLTCGLASWWGGGKFFDYGIVTENVEEYMRQKEASKILCPDDYIFPSTMDFLSGDTIYTKSTKNLNGIVNVNKEITGKSYLKNGLSFVDTPSGHTNADDRSGFVVTDLTNTEHRIRFFFLIRADYVNNEGKATYFDAYVVEDDVITWTSDMNLQKALSLDGLTRDNNMSMYVEGTTVKVLINGVNVFDQDLSTHGLGSQYKLGFTSWKSYSVFSNIELTLGDDATTKYSQDCKA